MFELFATVLIVAALAAVGVYLYQRANKKRPPGTGPGTTPTVPKDPNTHER